MKAPIRHLLALLLLLTPAVSLACVNGVRLSKSAVVKSIAKAEALIADGKYNQALKTLNNAFERDGIKNAPPRFAEVHKAQALAAIAIVRSGDTAIIDDNARARAMQKARARAAQKGLKSARPKAKTQSNLPWAFKELMEYAKHTQQAPQAVSWLAEAQVASGVIEPAFTALNGLAKDDLLTDAHGWLTLARLRDAKEDAAGAKAALTRCKAMAKDASICTVGPGLGGS